MEPPFAPTSWAPAWRPRCARPPFLASWPVGGPDEAERLTRAGVTALIVDDLALLARLAAPVSAAPERRTGLRRISSRATAAPSSETPSARLDAEAEGERRLGAQAVGRDEGRDERRVPHSDVAGEIATTPDSTINAYTRMAAWARASRGVRQGRQARDPAADRDQLEADRSRRARRAAGRGRPRPRRGRAPHGRSAPAGAGRPAPGPPARRPAGRRSARQGRSGDPAQAAEPAGRGMTIAATATTTKVTRPSTTFHAPTLPAMRRPPPAAAAGGGGWRRTGRRGRAVRAGARPRRARASGRSRT